jgi:hypothetical protein
MKSAALTPLLVAAVLVFAGCQTRSISNSGFRENGYYGGDNGYRGELSEFDVLGVETGANVTDADIVGALRDNPGVRLARADRVLLIQSGADFPDAPMQEAMGRAFEVGPFSGKPLTKKEPGQSYAKSLRLAAARGGYGKIVCYWGVLESERVNQATKIVSWVPFAGSVVPDERENMRLRLKAAVIDVATGRWTMVQSAPVADTRLSARAGRKDKDQELVEQLKAQGYADLARLLSPPPAG